MAGRVRTLSLISDRIVMSKGRTAAGRNRVPVKHTAKHPLGRGRPTGDSGVKNRPKTSYARWLAPITLFVLAGTHGCTDGSAANAVGEGLSNAIAALAEAAFLTFVL